MRYIPFNDIEQIEKYYCHSVYHKDYGEMTVVGAKKTRTSTICVYLVDSNGKEIAMNSENLMNETKFKGHPFALKLEDMENENV